jgi:hypothetical protein
VRLSRRRARPSTMERPGPESRPRTG